MGRLNDAETEVLYGKAEKCLGQSAKALKAQALLAYEQRKSNDAMRVLSFVWGRNARNLSRAVVRWPSYFMSTGGVLPPDMDPDAYQALFLLASLPLKKANELERKWRQYSWRAWRVRQEVEDWRGEQKDPKLLRLRGTAKVLNVDAEYTGGTMLTLLIPHGQNDPRPEWAGRQVVMLLTEDKDKGT